MLCALAVALLTAAQFDVAPAAEVELISGRVGPLGLPLPECPKQVTQFSLRAALDAAGAAAGTLTLDPLPLPVYDEFGFPVAAGPNAAPAVALDCKFALVKKTVKVTSSHRQGAPPEERREFRTEWRLYALTGPKITSKLSLVTAADSSWQSAMLLVHDAKGKVQYVVDLRAPPQPEPCHPGCFPAGTPVRTPGGPKPVDALREGDAVTTVTPAGAAGRAAVAKVFVTRNRLIEVATTAGTLTTTAAQPLALAAGGLTPAGDLKPGDRILAHAGTWRWPATVKSVAATGRTATVYNVVLAEPGLFVAGGFLARSKPPAGSP